MSDRQRGVALLAIHLAGWHPVLMTSPVVPMAVSVGLACALRVLRLAAVRGGGAELVRDALVAAAPSSAPAESANAGLRGDSALVAVLSQLLRSLQSAPACPSSDKAATAIM